MFLGLICHCTPGFGVKEDVNPCEKDNNTGYYARECASGGVCLVTRHHSSNRIIPQCAYGQIYRLGCVTHGYDTIDVGNSLCCETDYCNSVEAFLEFRANQSHTTDDEVEETTDLTGTAILPTASPTGELSLN